MRQSTKRDRLIVYALIAVFHPTMESLMELTGFSRSKLDRLIGLMRDRILTVNGHPCHYEVRQKDDEQHPY